MKKIVVIIFMLILILVGSFAYNKKDNEEVLKCPVVSTTEYEDNTVIIKEYNIDNEELIDNFIEIANYENEERQELNIKQDDKEIKVIYNPGEYAKAKSLNADNTNIPISDGSAQSNKFAYGYYSLIIDGKNVGEYPLFSHTIKRSISDNIVIVYFDAELIDYSAIPEICRYNIESSNYSKKFDLYYHQRKDLGISKVYDAEDFSVKTFGGDVLITIEDDMVYNLEDALNKGVITTDDILEQAKIDAKYGVCLEAYYSDGGSTEYKYYNTSENQYTILKLNTLEGDKDLVVGMSGKIIDIYNNAKNH